MLETENFVMGLDFAQPWIENRPTNLSETKLLEFFPSYHRFWLMISNMSDQFEWRAPI